MRVRTASLITCLLAIALLVAPLSGESLEYPKTKRIDHTDNYHGTTVRDPYRWLEDDVRESQEVADWVAAQNRVTVKYLESIGERDAIRERLTKLWDYEKLGTPWKRGGRYFFTKNDGLQNQSVLYVTDSWDQAPRVLLDPNAWSEDGTVALAGRSASPDGRYLAYGVAEAGSDWRRWKVLEIDSGETLDDQLDWVKYSDAEWTPDSRGFFYGRYAPPKKGTEFQGLALGQELYYHRVGTPQSEDVLVHMVRDHPEWSFGADVTDDGRYLVISTRKSSSRRGRISVRDLSEPYGMLTDIVDNFDNQYTFLGSSGTVLYFRTDLEAPRRRVIAIDLRHPEPENWREIVSESPDTLQWSRFVGNMFVLGYLHDAKTAVRLYTEDGRFVREVSLPGIGTASGFWGTRSDTETFYSFSSFNVPTSTYRYDLISGNSELLQRADVGIDPEAFEVNQVFYDSKDGTKVPMFIVHRKGVELDGSNPTLLYGYGGFNVSQVPRFSISRLAWMEMGGVFALANLRGGGEYGEEWHQAGTKLQKQNVFDDFIAAAEYLIDSKVTSEKKLAIQGGSNGGLLVGAAMTQRPELFGAALPAVGVMDMLRFHKFTAGRFWTEDYGSSDNPDEFEAILAYSPYHNLKKGTEYPPTLVTTADTDDRVVPGHSFKFASQLQWAHKGDNPVLIRIETRAGHGAGKPTSKRIEEIADQWAFLVESLDMEIGPKVESAMSQEGM
jgi:prolyl oligopeptidase